ncbi:MAG: hypothetical protein GY834_02370 [Bacteroidetes bacterium]|nr:hypothetical protein [Bacteroidota bacterium]
MCNVDEREINKAKKGAEEFEKVFVEKVIKDLTHPSYISLKAYLKSAKAYKELLELKDEKPV